METLKIQLYDDLAQQYNDGIALLNKELKKQQSDSVPDEFVLEMEYQTWYSVSAQVIQQVSPTCQYRVGQLPLRV
ncbi:MAG: hypothetical protein OYM47_17735 [Gemmatimonadota bacterium]|nr:hypothetical protein [Gemmatimonadota bacterium]